MSAAAVAAVLFLHLTPAKPRVEAAERPPASRTFDPSEERCRALKLPPSPLPRLYGHLDGYLSACVLDLQEPYEAASCLKKFPELFAPRTSKRPERRYAPATLSSLRHQIAQDDGVCASNWNTAACDIRKQRDQFVRDSCVVVSALAAAELVLGRTPWWVWLRAVWLVAQTVQWARRDRMAQAGCPSEKSVAPSVWAAVALTVVANTKSFAW